MKTAKWCLAGAALGLISGCASQSANNNTTNTAAPPTTMNASYSSDTAGIQTEEVGAPRGAYLPPSEIPLEDLPQPVQATVRREAGGVPIDRIVRETKKGQTVYKVELKREDGRMFHGTMIVAADGALLKESHISEAAGANAPTSWTHEGNPIERVPNGPNPATTTNN